MFFFFFFFVLTDSSPELFRSRFHSWFVHPFASPLTPCRPLYPPTFPKSLGSDGVARGVRVSDVHFIDQISPPPPSSFMESSAPTSASLPAAPHWLAAPFSASGPYRSPQNAAAMAARSASRIVRLGLSASHPRGSALTLIADPRCLAGAAVAIAAEKGVSAARMARRASSFAGFRDDAATSGGRVVDNFYIKNFPFFFVLTL
jgi:hypothetical protein